MKKTTTLQPEMRYDRGHFTIHLLNPTNVNYDRVIMESGAYFFDNYDGEEKLINTNTFTKEYKNLPAQGELQIDRSDFGELDYTIWYKIKLFTADSEAPEELTFKLVGGKIRFTQ